MRMNEKEDTVHRQVNELGSTVSVSILFIGPSIHHTAM